MWLLTDEKDGKCYYVLKEKEKHTISRQTGDIVISNDQSISRIHSFLFPINDGLFVMDAGSKYGTYVNENIDIQKNQIKPNTKVQLNDGDRVMFGRLGSKWKVTKYNYRCFTSTLVIKDDLQAILNRMEVTIVPAWDSDCTHLIMSQITVTHKLLLCLVSAMHVITPEFFHTCMRCIETGEPLPDCTKFTPAPSPEEKSLATWKNISMQPDIQRSKLFCGKQFVFTKKKMCDVYETLIKKAGGQCRSVERQNLSKRELIATNTIVIESSSGDTQQTQQSQAINMIKSFLNDNNRRLVPDPEIGLAILYISTEKYCNPEYHFKFSIDSQQHVAPKTQFAKATEHFETLKHTNVQNTPVHIPDSAAVASPFKIPTTIDRKPKETPILVPETDHITPSLKTPTKVTEAIDQLDGRKRKAGKSETPRINDSKESDKSEDETNKPVASMSKETLEFLHQEGRRNSRRHPITPEKNETSKNNQKSASNSKNPSINIFPESSSNRIVNSTKSDNHASILQLSPTENLMQSGLVEPTISTSQKDDSDPFIGFNQEEQIKSPIAKSTQLEIDNENASNKKRKRTSDGNTNTAKKPAVIYESAPSPSQSIDVSIVNSQNKVNDVDQSLFLCSRRHEQPEQQAEKPSTSAPKRTMRMVIDDDDEDEDNLFNFKNKKVRQNVEKPQVFTPGSTFRSTQTQQPDKRNEAINVDDDEEALFSFSSMKKPAPSKEVSRNQRSNQTGMNATTNSTTTYSSSGLNIPDLIRPIRSNTSIDNWLSSTLSNIDLKEEIKSDEYEEDVSSVKNEVKPEQDEENRAWLSDIKNLFQISVVHLNLQSKSNISIICNDTTDYSANLTTSRNFKAFVKKRNYVPQKSILPLKSVLIDTANVDLDF